jgi:alpha-glucosidase
MLATDHYIRLERVDSVDKTPHGILATLGGEQLRVDVLRSDLLRFKISRAGAFDESPSFAVCVDPLERVPPFGVEHAGDGRTVRLTTDDVVLTLGLDPFRIDVHRHDGSVVLETAADDDGRYWPYATFNDAFTIRRRCREEDAIFGLGEKTGQHNRRGRDYTMWNIDALDPHASAEFTAGRSKDDPRSDRTSTGYDPYYITIPFFYHQAKPAGAMSASFIDNGYRGYYDFTGRTDYAIHFSGGQYTEYVFAGPDMARILEGYTWLTGRLRPPPLWSLGYHQCRWFRYDQDAVEAVGRRHRALDIPCDALWLDIEYMDGYRVFTWDRDRFPDPPAMLARLGADGFQVVTIIDPGVKHEPGYRVFDEGVERDVLCRTEGGDVYIGQVWPGNTAFPDFVTEAGRTWWAELNAAHARSGVAGIWNDMNEPATGSVESSRMRFDHGRYSHEKYHNQYALLMAMGTVAGLLDARPDRRPFVLSRAGFAGIQRVAANWMGDNLSRWDHLWMSIPMAMGLGVSGQAFVGADVGGFAGDSEPELFLRWMQYATLTPFCRNHTEIGSAEQYPWSFGGLVQDLVRAAIRLRYQLLPYLYACFIQAAETGAPVQRPLVFDHQYDALASDIDDEYLLGPDLLVAPVLAPGTTARQVYLPDGQWYDWHTGDPVGGRRWVVAATPMDRIPIYARGGSVIPMWPEAPPSAAGHQPSAIELHLFVPDDGGLVHHSTLQEDDGSTFGADDGARYRTTFALRRRGEHLHLDGRTEGDGFPEFRRTQLVLHLHGAGASAVLVDGRRATITDGVVPIANAGTSFEADITLA